MPPTVITMNSTVRFAVESSRQEFQLTLFYPKDTDSSGDTISVLAPVGSALLGLSAGDEIEWSRLGGGPMTVRIVEVVFQHERAGELHRWATDRPERALAATQADIRTHTPKRA